MSLLLSLTPQLLPAQSEAPQSSESSGTSSESAAQVEDQGQTILDMFKNGGWAMYPLGLLSICALGLIVYNFQAVNPSRLLGSKVLPDIIKALEALDLDKARSICRENASPSTNIIHAGLARADLDAYDSKTIKEAIEESSTEELAGPFVLINYLSVIGSLAPMVGLLEPYRVWLRPLTLLALRGLQTRKLLLATFRRL